MRRAMKNDGTMVVADVVSSEITEKSALQNVIEALRDPSHARMHSASQLASLICSAGLTIQREDTWDEPREFEEWG
jgi:hypothetical protein